MFSNLSSVFVAKASVILAFQFVISGTGVQNTLSLTYPLKRSQGGDIRRSWWPGCRTISPNPPVCKCCIQKPMNIWIPVWRCTILLENYPRLKLLLTEVQRKVPKCPGSFLVINVCNQGKTLCSPCRFSLLSLSLQHRLSHVWWVVAHP